MTPIRYMYVVNLTLPALQGRILNLLYWSESQKIGYGVDEIEMAKPTTLDSELINCRNSSQEVQL